MATMDIQALWGLARELSGVGGGLTEKVTEAFQDHAAPPKLKAILVNIFGGS